MSLTSLSPFSASRQRKAVLAQRLNCALSSSGRMVLAQRRRCGPSAKRSTKARVADRGFQVKGGIHLRPWRVFAADCRQATSSPQTPPRCCLGASRSVTVAHTLRIQRQLDVGPESGNEPPPDHLKAWKTRKASRADRRGRSPRVAGSDKCSWTRQGMAAKHLGSLAAWCNCSTIKAWWLRTRLPLLFPPATPWKSPPSAPQERPQAAWAPWQVALGGTCRAPLAATPAVNRIQNRQPTCCALDIFHRSKSGASRAIWSSFKVSTCSCCRLLSSRRPY